MEEDDLLPWQEKLDDMNRYARLKYGNKNNNSVGSISDGIDGDSSNKGNN